MICHLWYNLCKAKSSPWNLVIADSEGLCIYNGRAQSLTIGGVYVYQKICDNRKTLVNCTFLLYILGVLCVTFIVRETMVLRTSEHRGVVLQPFREFDAMVNGRHFFWFKQISLNVLLFVPFGFLLPCVNRLFRNPLITVTTGCIFSGFIEITQYICICRSQNRNCTDLEPSFNGYKTAHLPLLNRTNVYERTFRANVVYTAHPAHSARPFCQPLPMTAHGHCPAKSEPA